MCSACAASDPGPITVVNHPHAATRMASTVARRCSSPLGLMASVLPLASSKLATSTARPDGAFTELAGKRRLIGQADRRFPPQRQFDGLEPHGRRDGTFRVDGPRKRDRLKFDSGGGETIQAGLIDGGRRLGLFRRREVVWSGM